MQVTPSIRLARRLGAGGMGSVWIAEHAALQTDVVVKFLADRLLEDPTSQARFAREAAAAAHVKSPHVVQMLDHGVTDDGLPYIVMELLEGRDLGKLVRERRLTPYETAHVIEHVALALGQAHSKGIVHRDIKPNNIFLCDVGASMPFVKLFDFGIARSGDEQLTATGHVVGTPSYMSPEQLSGETVGPKSDLWSLGMVTFKALTGANPFDRPTLPETMGAVLHAKLPVPTQFTPELPPGVDAWFARACARDPAERFGSAAEMAEALWAALGVDRVIASSPSGNALSSVELTVPITGDPITEGTLRSTVGSSSANALRASLAPPRPRIWIPVAVGVLGALVVSGILVSIGVARDREVSVLGSSARSVAARVAAIEIRHPPAPPAPPAPSPEPVPEPSSVAKKRATPAPPVAKPASRRSSDDEENLGF